MVVIYQVYYEMLLVEFNGSSWQNFVGSYIDFRLLHEREIEDILVKTIKSKTALSSFSINSEDIFVVNPYSFGFCWYMYFTLSFVRVFDDGGVLVDCLPFAFDF